MNPKVSLLAVTLLITSWSAAQETPQDAPKDPVQSAIRKFNRNKSKKPAEVTVVLPPPSDNAPTPPSDSTKPESPATAPPKAPVLVTGKAPQDAEFIKPSEETATPPILTDEPAPPRKGLEVHVEKVQTGTGNIEPSQVKIHTPFPAKPLADPPAGWHLVDSADAPPFIREVELSPGKKITLTIRPHLLVPDTDATGAFTIPEPGYDPSLGYRQNATVAAVLSKSIQQMNEDSKQLGTVIDNLQQFLVSLPKPEPTPEPAATPAHKPKR